MKKTQKAETNKSDEYPVDFVSRAAALSISESTINEEERTIEAIIATSNPVTVLDRNRWEVVDEILMMDGVVLPESRQVPFLNDHSRYGTESIIGSARKLKVEEEAIKGKIHFARKADEQWDLVREGHLTDVSAGYRIFPESSIYIERGQEVKVGGKTIKNKGVRTLAVRTKWEIKEVSATPIGADEETKMRNEKTNSKGESMSEETTKETTATVERNVEQEIEERSEEKSMTKAHNMVERSLVANEKLAARAKLMGLTDDEYKEAKKGYTFFEEEHERKVLDRMFEIQKEKLERVDTETVASVSVTKDETDNFRKIASLAIRNTANCDLTSEEVAEVRSSVYNGLTIHTAMRSFLILNGVREAAWLPPLKLVDKCNEISRAHSVSTGDLANVFLDVANKSLASGYQEVDTVNELLTGRDSAPDFKPKYTIKVSKLGDLEKMLPGEGFPHTFMTDSKESVQLEIYGLAMGLDLRAIINDDLGALTKVPQELGASVRRKEELLFWTFFYGTNMVGPTMGEDSLAMFHASHSNFVASGSGAAPSTTTLVTARQAMMKQTLPAPDNRANTQYTNAVAKYIVAHSNLMQTVEQRVTASYDIDSAATNATNTPNMKFINSLVPVFSPYLDAKMDAASTPHNGWYLLSDPRSKAVVNKVKLQGYETPTIRSKDSDVGEPLGRLWDVWYSIAYGQVDYRYAYANYGAAQ